MNGYSRERYWTLARLIGGDACMLETLTAAGPLRAFTFDGRRPNGMIPGWRPCSVSLQSDAVRPSDLRMILHPYGERDRDWAYDLACDGDWTGIDALDEDDVDETGILYDMCHPDPGEIDEWIGHRLSGASEDDRDMISCMLSAWLRDHHPFADFDERGLLLHVESPTGGNRILFHLCAETAVPVVTVFDEHASVRMRVGERGNLQHLLDDALRML
ncbi:hypothetical protein [Bifidobacterium sp. SO1]|uniref:hypothetical protein n=1 Tax=Bifidobacterium sp. SO1 TaxID=2809029 RepID=UPI001BDCB7E1|nr:hypothetical protein [Bifidobacterium sp. SO1]MBT1161686.1 hypothetical protein [Bifidobacterium sp. SO1]